MWDGLTNQWTLADFQGYGDQPGPALGFDRATNNLYLYRNARTHVWDRDNSAWVPLREGPLPDEVERQHPAIVYSGHIGTLVLIGGRERTSWMNDMWTFDRDIGDWRPLRRRNSTNNAQWPSVVELPADQTLLQFAARTYTWCCEDPYYCLADLNSDHALNFFDVALFLQWFSEQDARADLVSPRWVYDFFDISEYLNRYSNGCP